MGCSHRYFIFASFILTLQTVDGAGTITWNEPPPQETTADANLIRTHNTQLIQGSTNVPLSWNFSLAADLNPIQGVRLELGGVQIVNIAPAFGIADVVNAFKDRFNLTWMNPQKATLIIFNVSSADEGEFACKVTTLGGGSTIWQRNIQVTVVVPPSITHISGNQTVIEGQNVTLNCEASGDPAPNIAWTRLSDNSTVTMPLINIRRQEEGCYRCTADNGVGSPTTRVTCIIVHFPPNITDISENQTVDEGDIVTLNCTADGNPVPTITWTRLSDNSPVNRLLNISGKEVDGFYRCTADNGIGIADRSEVFIYVENYRPTDTNLTTNLTNNTVVLNDPFNLMCSSDANPPGHYRLYKEQQLLTAIKDNQAVGTFTTSIGERIKQVTYSCTPNNSFGVGQSDTAIVTVHYNPADVTLLANPTENENCSDLLLVNFTCVASEANPEVQSFLLYDGGNETTSSNNGTWLKDILVPGKHVYGCIAHHPEGNVNSSNTVTVTFNVPVEISVNLISGSETLGEGGDVSLYCDASGYPEPTVTWSKLGDDLFVNGSPWLNFTNITREDRGNYVCRASNTCGKNASVQVINVQYKPADVTLLANPGENENCSDLLRVNFTCVASDANPEVESYLFFDGGNESSASNSETWLKDISVPGKHVYSCRALHPEGNVNSSNTVTVTYFVPVKISVDVITGNETLKEGGNVSLYCDASGYPNPTVTWSKRGDDRFVNRNAWLNFTNIKRDEAGNYNCHANNTCGKNSSSVRTVDVQYKPINVTLKLNMSMSKGCKGDVVEFKCESDAANPAVHTYLLYENVVMPGNMGRTGVTTRALDTEGQVTYKCDATNSVGTAASTNKTVVVEVPALVTSVSNTTVVKEGENVTLRCNFSGDPAPNVSWVNSTNNVMIVNSTWEILNIGRNYTGGYKCIASNECGSHSKTTNISVEFPPSNTSSGRNETISLGRPFNFTCPVDGNPPPSIRWYNSSGSLLSSKKEFEFTPNSLGDTGLYTCFASNYLGNTSVTFGLKVAPMTPTSPTTPACGYLQTDVHVTLVVRNEGCKDPGDVAQVKQEFPDKVYSEGKRHFLHLKSVKVNDTRQNTERTEPQSNRCGSVIVDLVLRFCQSVNVSKVISILKHAAKNGSFGQFKVDPDSVELTITGRVFSSEPTKGPPPCKKSFFQNDDCSVNWLHLILIIVVAVVLIIIIAAAGGCWIHKKRKCRKDTRIACDPGSEEQRLQRDDPYAQVNNGYAETGPRSVNSREKGAAAVPDYAVVDKSAKKKKKQDEEKPPDYAVVDKSKKTKKNEKGDDTYAKVDMSKKTSKKKRKPGEEMLYADLGDFSGASQMPTVATSPKAQAQLPPIKRPESYEGTQYADITQFLKGDATLPIDDKQDGQQGAELKEKEGKTDGAGGENAPKETPM